MDVRAAAEAANKAARALLASDDAVRRQAMVCIGDAILAAKQQILQANQEDLDAATDLAPAMRQRLELPRQKLEAALTGLRQLAEAPDPLHRIVDSKHVVDGLYLFQETVPIGTIACIFESRPDVCIQIPALTIRSGNAVLLKGGTEAQHTNAAIVDAVQAGLQEAGLPKDAVTLLPGRQEVQELLAMDDLVDLIVPRGSNALVRSIQDNTRIPVMGHAEGICHIYIDSKADLAKAEAIVLDAKTDYPSACNAVETILVHEELASWWHGMAERLVEAGVQIHTEADFDTEYGALEVAVRFVPNVDEAMDHIARHGSKHTDAIVTEDAQTAMRFVHSVDSAGVFVNASTRFADGFRYGLGAEVGISTGKLHARGPVGLEGLLSRRWVMVGDGHTAGALKAEDYLHAPHDGDIRRAIEGQ